MDRFYDGFVSRAAAGRGVDYDVLEAHARGRIWTGEQAVELGLVDRVGGLREAIAEAARRAGLGANPELVLVEPPHPGLFERIRSIGPPGLGALEDLRGKLGLPTSLLQARLPVDVTIR
jgi:ClpP class serine protease